MNMFESSKVSVHTTAGKKGDFDVERALKEGRGLTPISYEAPKKGEWKNRLLTYEDAVAMYQPKQLQALQAGLADKIEIFCMGGLCPRGLWCVHRLMCYCSEAQKAEYNEQLKAEHPDHPTITDQYGSALCPGCLNVL